MKIEQVSLKNFRCFEQLDVTFHPQLTVLIAPMVRVKLRSLMQYALRYGPLSKALIWVAKQASRPPFRLKICVLNAANKKWN
jgi:hypothetical protein